MAFFCIENLNYLEKANADITPFLDKFEINAENFGYMIKCYVNLT